MVLLLETNLFALILKLKSFQRTSNGPLAPRKRDSFRRGGQFECLRTERNVEPAEPLRDSDCCLINPIFARESEPSAERLSKCALSRGAPQRHGSKMRSRSPLLLAVLAAACLRFGSAEVRATLNALINLSFLSWS